MEKQEKILSIIIPVYKVEKYIRKCLDSIFKQEYSYGKVEVIVVNDGTPDNSMEIVKEFAVKYNIEVIEQSNQGLSMARNNGLLKATGRYVWFVDSDDWLQKDSIHTVLECIDKHNVDMISTRLIRVKEDDGSCQLDVRNRYIDGKKYIVGKDYLFDEGIYAPVQQFIYKRDFLKENDLNFFPNIYHEDGQFNVRALYLSKQVYLLDIPVYNCLLRGSGSIMKSMTIKNALDLLLIHRTLLAFGREKVDANDVKIWNAIIAGFLSVIFNWLAQMADDDSFKKFYSENKYYINKYIWDMMSQRHFHKHTVKVCFMIRFFPFVYMKSFNKHNIKNSK